MKALILKRGAIKQQQLDVVPVKILIKQISRFVKTVSQIKKKMMLIAEVLESFAVIIRLR